MKKILFTIIFSGIGYASFSQQLTATFGGSPVKHDWQRGGYPGDTVPGFPVVDITTFGGNNTGTVANDLALANAVSSLGGADAVIYFPPGNYLFTGTINLRSGLILRGAGSGNTTLTFNLGAGSGHLISVQGSAGASTPVTAAVQQYSNQVTVTNPGIASIGNFIKVYQDNETGLINDSWANNTVGQISYLKSKSGNTFTFYTRHRRAIPLSGAPTAQLLNMVKRAGIECLKIKRMDPDPTANQTSNIIFNYAAFCWVKGIESDSANFAHISILNSSNIEVTGSYFHGAFSYGGGGEGYGVVCHLSTGDCLIENNIFKRLRHAMLLQAGANGNIYSYNYSLEQLRTELPSDAAADIVLHGNYPYANLFEGNIAQNTGGDASHGINGPANVFFRNRALHYGIAFSSGSGDSSLVIYNEVTGTGNSGIFPFLPLGGLGTNGPNSIASKNYRVLSGGFVGNMESSFAPNQAATYAYFLEPVRPYFFSADLQPMGFPAVYNSPFTSIPARDRFIAAGTFTYCSNVSRKDSMMPVICDPLAIASNGGYDVHDIAETNEYRDNSNCGLIATLLPSGAAPVSGIIKTKTSIDATVQSYNGKAYVQRHYDIEPLVNAPAATAVITLYFTQQEFDNYNAANGAEPDLPTGPGDATGKSNLRVTQYHGTGTAPGNYSGSTELIDPVDASIVWNGTTGLWEISFAVTGFSGFYVSGSYIVLPVRLISFNYSLPGTHIVLLKWKVAGQQGIRSYVMERSTDGIAWSSIGSIAANSETGFTYQYTDYNPVAGLNYYRLRVEEDNGRSYSNVLAADLSEQEEEMVIYPVPAKDELRIRLINSALLNTEIRLLSAEGRLLQKIKLQTIGQNIPVGHLPAGIYYLETGNGKTYKVIKQ
ncbi:MAG: T9SS type A sorting domain-containing protein [Chitinophagaceae bacterium]|nr:T9SS type A sorting domain-containing protein [Chitinophagaceae bacterium]